jgi:hypothetical protein
LFFYDFERLTEYENYFPHNNFRIILYGIQKKNKSLYKNFRILTLQPTKKVKKITNVFEIALEKLNQDLKQEFDT